MVDIYLPHFEPNDFRLVPVAAAVLRSGLFVSLAVVFVSFAFSLRSVRDDFVFLFLVFSVLSSHFEDLSVEYNIAN